MKLRGDVNRPEFPPTKKHYSPKRMSGQEVRMNSFGAAVDGSAGFGGKKNVYLCICTFGSCFKMVNCKQTYQPLWILCCSYKALYFHN